MRTLTPPAPVFEDVYRDEYAGLVRLAWTLTGRWPVAEELVQEAFLRAHQRWDRVGGYERPGAWVRRVVLNRATSRARRAAAEARALVRLAGRREVEPTMAPHDHEFWAAVRSLPRRQAQVVALFYVDDLAVGDIAGVLDVAEATVRATLHQARGALARRLGEQEETPT